MSMELMGMLPLSIKEIVTLDKINPTKTLTETFLQSDNGQTIDMTSVPVEWVKYIKESANNYPVIQDKLSRRGVNINRKTEIGTLTLYSRVKPITESKCISKTTDGQYILAYSKEYKEWSKNVCNSNWKLLTTIPLKSVPIKFPVRIEIIFNIKSTRKKLSLTECIDSVLEIMIKMGIIKSKNESVVRSVSGSRFKNTTTKEKIEVAIHTYTGV